MKQLLQYTKTAILALTLVAGLSYISAWTAPTATPPGDNVAAPVNVSSTDQTKAGGIFMSSLGTTGGAYIAGNLGVGVLSPVQKLEVNGYVKGTSGLCIGSDCRSSWAGAGDGTTKLYYGWAQYPCGPGIDWVYAVGKFFPDGGSYGGYPSGTFYGLVYNSSYSNWTNYCHGMWGDWAALAEV